jgi:AcrR family transcriptional regulator
MTELPTSLRERKKAKTRLAIREHAMALFKDQGYDRTTVEQIAAAAEVSPSTFFRYFPSKEEVVLQDDYDALLIAAFHAQKADVPPLRALRNAITEVFSSMPESQQAQEAERIRIMSEVPELRARMLASAAKVTTSRCEPLPEHLSGWPSASRQTLTTTPASTTSTSSIVPSPCSSRGFRYEDSQALRACRELQPSR